MKQEILGDDIVLYPCQFCVNQGYTFTRKFKFGLSYRSKERNLKLQMYLVYGRGA